MNEIKETRLKELKKEIKKGLESGEPSPLDIEEVINRGRKRWALKICRLGRALSTHRK